ncbi:TonB family protein [Dyella halodurans]|uniref:Protein TonB n=1 Tax=Dyella halodurans TaxID=1920171 RepID=A0ABV9BYC8_9GAMM|nr:energy transducer TonB [Dyella halodurans]
MLTLADPQNYTLTLLQAKLQAQRDAVAQQAPQAPQTPKSAPPAPPTPGVATASRAVAPIAATAVVPQPATSPMLNKAANVPTAAEQALARLQVESTPVEAAPRAAVKPRAPAVVAVADAQGATAPAVARRIEPVYPPDARRQRRQGWVDVTFVVQPDGSVAAASVADADPKYVFDRAALSAVTRWTFTPGTQDGKPVASQVRQRIEFRL